MVESVKSSSPTHTTKVRLRRGALKKGRVDHNQPIFQEKLINREFKSPTVSLVNSHDVHADGKLWMGGQHDEITLQMRYENRYDKISGAQNTIDSRVNLKSNSSPDVKYWTGKRFPDRLALAFHDRFVESSPRDTVSQLAWIPLVLPLSLSLSESSIITVTLWPTSDHRHLDTVTANWRYSTRLTRHERASSLEKKYNLGPNEIYTREHWEVGKSTPDHLRISSIDETSSFLSKIYP